MQHYLGVFESEQLAVARYNERAKDVGRFPADGADSPSTSTSTCGSEDSRLLVAKVLLGRSIRDLAAANHQLSSALASGADQVQVRQLAADVQHLLEQQNSCLGEISSLA